MKQILTTKNSLVLSFPRYHPIDQQKVFSKYLIILIAGFAMFVMSCQKEELPNNPQQQGSLISAQKQTHQKQVAPFKAVFQTTLKNIQAATDVLPELDSVTGTGEGTHIGNSTFAGLAVYTPPDFRLTGNAVITSANGDQIYATAHGPSPAPDANGNILLIYHAIITGGTGKFKGATGGWITTAHASIYSTTGTDSLKGIIIY